MATTPKRISALTSATTPLGGTEVAAIVQSGTTKKVAVSDIAALTYSFKTIDCPAGTDPVADSSADTLTLAGTGVTITGDSGADSVTFLAKSRTLATVTTPVTISNSVTETTIFTYTIPGGTLPADGRLVLDLEHAYTNSTGVARGYTWDVALGGTEVLNYATGAAFASGSGPRHGYIRIVIQALGSTSSQDLYFQLEQASLDSSGTLTTGSGQGSHSNCVQAFQRATSAQSNDMTSNQTLAVTITLSAASASHTWETFGGSLRVEAP